MKQRKINKTKGCLRQKNCQPFNQEEKNQFTKIKNESGDVTVDTIEIKKIIREYYEQLHTNIQMTEMTWTNIQEDTNYQN